MKIESITDVITNSSSEVFTLNTDKTTDEVYQWLKDNVKWAWEPDTDEYAFSEPEVMDKGSELIDWLIDFEYLWDSSDPKSVHDYKVHNCLHFASNNIGGDADYDYKIKRYGRIVRNQFEKFCENNMDELLTYFKDYKYINTVEDFWNEYSERMDFDPSYVYPADGWTRKFDGFLEKFIVWYEENFTEYIPKWWSIPEHLDVQYWKGKVGFCTNGENSISYEDMERILDEFGGEHWHMG